MQQYIATVIISDDDDFILKQTYKVTAFDLLWLTHLDHYDEGACCGQSKCFVCKMGSLHIKYSKHTDKKISVTSKPKFTLDNLRDYVESSLDTTINEIINDKNCV